jgi:hypothetical protein
MDLEIKNSGGDFKMSQWVRFLLTVRRLP